jgi:hypothetical protein
MSAAILVLVRDDKHLQRWEQENPAIADLPAIVPIMLDGWATTSSASTPASASRT